MRGIKRVEGQGEKGKKDVVERGERERAMECRTKGDEGRIVVRKG